MADIVTLCVVAHPDDESLFAGATLARLSANGSHRVQVIALSDGVTSRWRDYDGGMVTGQKLDMIERRKVQFHEACRVLGADGEYLPSFHDQQSDRVPQLHINRDVGWLMAKYTPKMVITHHVGDLNIDHRRVAEAVLVATRGFSGQVFSMAPEWPSRCVGPAWNPDTEWDITDTRETKVRACLCYVDEMREYPHPRSERAIREQTVERFMEIR